MRIKFTFILLMVVGLTACSDFQEREYIKRELSGPLIKLQDIQHGQFYLYIADYKTKDTVRYALRISKFLRENNIQKGDSISKEAESHTTWFYKKEKGSYVRHASLYYY